MSQMIAPQNLSIWHVHCNGTRLKEFRPQIVIYVYQPYCDAQSLTNFSHNDTIFGKKSCRFKLPGFLDGNLAAMWYATRQLCVLYACLCACVRIRISPSALPCSSSSLRIESQKQKHIKIGNTRRVTHGTNLISSTKKITQTVETQDNTTTPTTTRLELCWVSDVDGLMGSDMEGKPVLKKTGHRFIWSSYLFLSGCFQKLWYPQIIHFDRVFHYKPSIFGVPLFLETSILSH